MKDVTNPLWSMETFGALVVLIKFFFRKFGGV